jgi:cell division protein ZapA (FtsZ GTPase activity inhibitor)
MEIIEINIGDKAYKISCNIGEEDKVKKLAYLVNKRYKKLEISLGNKASAEIILVIMGLMLEDEILELRQDKNEVQNDNNHKIQHIVNRFDKIIAGLAVLE